MTLYLSTDTTQPKSPITAISGISGFTPYHRIYDYLYAVDTTQPIYPWFQSVGWSYSAVEHNPSRPSVPEIPSYTGPDYPFVAPSEDIQGYVIDAYFSFDDPLHEFEVPIKLSRITKHGENLYSVRFTDANDNVIFDSSTYRYTMNSIKVDGDTYTEKATNKRGDCVYKHYDWGWEHEGQTLYQLLYWETELITLKMTIRRTTVEQFTLYPDSAEMDARAIYQYPDRIRSIKVENMYQNSIPTIYGQTSGIVTGGSVQLWERYNMKFEWEDNSDLRTSTIVTMSAIPGAGEGVVPAECKPEERTPPVSSFNNTTATPTGDFFIKGDACHTIGGTTQIEIGNSCTPCCECQDMTDVGRLLNDLEDEYYCIGGKYKIAVDMYKAEVENITARATAEEETEDPSVEYIVVKGNRLFAKFRFIFRNVWTTCLNNLTLTVSTTNMELDSRYVSQSAPTEKDYSDCLAMDYLPAADITKRTGSYTVQWTDPIVTNQQVILKGLYRLNTKETLYSTSVTSLTYEDEEGNTVSVNLTGHIHSYTLSYNDRNIDYDDFTNDDTLRVNEFNSLADSVRNKCMKDEVDAHVIRNTHPSSDIVTVHRDPQSDYNGPTNTKRYKATHNQ